MKRNKNSFYLKLKLQFVADFVYNKCTTNRSNGVWAFTRWERRGRGSWRRTSRWWWGWRSRSTATRCPSRRLSADTSATSQDYETFHVLPCTSKKRIRTPDDGAWRRRRSDDGAGRGLRRRHCNRVAVEQKFNSIYLTNWSGKNAEFTSRPSKPLRNAHATKSIYEQWSWADFNPNQSNHISLLTPSGGRRSSLRTKYTNRLNPGDNRSTRNVPLPSRPPRINGF